MIYRDEQGSREYIIQAWAEEIRIDSYLRQEWNHMVDRAVTDGVTEEELFQMKKKEITVPAQESIMKAGWKPDQFRKILQKAIRKLRGIHSVYERNPERRI